MKKHISNNIKLGLFVLAGLLFLILLLYMIGRNRNMFGSNYVLKARFENVHGLVSGNNVRFSGIQSGTVKSVKILNDTVIEVTMLIDKKMKDVIRKDALVSIGTDGLVGNKVVNITPSRLPSLLAVSGDILPSKKAIDTDEMLQTLFNTNNDVAVIASGLKTTVERINSNNALWALLNDPALPRDVRQTMTRIRAAAANVDQASMELESLLTGIRNGKGSLGAIITDSSYAQHLHEAIVSIKSAGEKADSISTQLSALVDGISRDMNSGHGVWQAMLKDSSLVVKINQSLEHIQNGTANFNQNMEALKHNFLFRGYFRKQEKLNKKKP